MRPDLPFGTVTFLFTDVEGSTKLLHALGADAYAEALAEHRRLIREACASEGGVEVDTQGDAFFFAFPNAPGAIAAASAFTEAPSAGPISARVGLHTGTPLLTDEGYVGDDVHFAARVASSGHGGQVVLSRATAELVELSLTDLGEHRLKDIEGAVSIFQLGDGSFPPLKTISNTNLPRPASSFVGRDAELEEVLSRIEGGARLVTLTGPGGTGKTRLALEAASSLVPSYKAGVFWVGLASLRDPSLVSETIAQTLGAKNGLTAHIAEREMLLLLDNLEQVIDVAPELSSVLSVCPNLTLLVTSRELLRIQGEVEYSVPPLAEPDAVALFCERAQVDSNEEIAELCVRLDSLPLAVELAAARVKALAPAQILERVSSRLDLLKGGRDADPRQQTLRATIEWSYELLSLEEQQLLGRLSVFAGGCTLEAAEAVASASLDTLQSLVEKSLLRYTSSEAGSRYWMLETIRDYAGERLVDRDEAVSVKGRHGQWFLGLATEAEPRLHGSEQRRWLDCLDTELGNLRAALAWGLGGGDRQVGLRLGGLLMWFWQLRSYLGEGEAWLAAATLEAVHEPPAVRARLLQGQGQLTYYKGDPGEAQRLLDQALGLWRASGDRAWDG